MREYYFQLIEYFQRGLRHERISRRNDPALIRCLNMKPTPWGLAALPEITNPIADLPTTTWPFPAIYRGKEITLLAIADKVYQVDEADWTFTQLTTFDIFLPLVEKAILPGGTWHFADMGTSWILTNGTAVVFRMGHDPKVYVMDSREYRTTCFFKGRTITAGFPNGMWNHNWDTFFETAGELAGLTITQRPGLNTVAWSMAGGGDVFWWLLDGLAQSGLVAGDYYNPGHPLFMDMWRRGDWGWMRTDWEGEILCVKPLGDKLMVYGDHGVSMMFPVMEPLPTFGQATVLPFGIAGRSAVGGDDNRHVFVDQSGELWTIDAQTQIQRLGYQEYMENLLSDEIVVSHDPQRGDFWIATDQAAFVLSTDRGKVVGLGESGVSPTNLHHTEGGLIGLAYDNALGESVKITTETFDLGVRGQKTIHSIDMAHIGLTAPKASTYWRNDPATAFKQTQAIPFSMEGYSAQPSSGVDLRAEITATGVAEHGKIDSAAIHWKATDKRFTRGAFAPIGVSSEKGAET